MSGGVVWITGLPSSGKSTLAARAHRALLGEGRASCLLDGDEVRDALVPRPGYDPRARDDFYETLARLAALLARQGPIVIVAATAHRRAYRERARALAPRLIEVYVDVAPATCRERDPKGLYHAAGAGEIGALPGAGADYEAPLAPEVVARGGEDEAALAALLERARSWSASAGAGPW
ncbi:MULTISPECIES: adenylyl-sulfate kinase [Sorangium]|uniref:Adenylyl-sulfate kinase n=1 Tax=Sorangium cellulosum (strain So ce56) TaxID=448385 RepID=A9GCE0_SORC5|nr:adenylyl-sulfate kinase [Sorangium cellulosum]CAN96175.1 adenylyl-sulfate kinase [Sorangium cellulosum So ce56]